MRFAPFLLLICAFGLRAQSAEPAPDTVIASLDGKTVTYGQLRAFVTALAPPEQQAAMLKNPAFLVHRYFMWQRLADMAEKEKLDQKSPTREQLYWDRLNLLVQAKLNEVNNQATATDEQLKKYYEDHQGEYTQARVKTIYIPFSSNPEAAGAGTKVLSEAEAKARAEKVLAQIRGGADFVKMVKEYSEDAASKAKDGDLDPLTKTGSIPEEIREAVFKLKPGEVSDPVRQPNGFYLFRVEEISTRTYQQVQGELYDIVRQQNYKEWLDQTDKSIKFKIEDPAFFKKAAAPAGPANPGK